MPEMQGAPHGSNAEASKDEVKSFGKEIKDKITGKDKPSGVSDASGPHLGASKGDKEDTMKSTFEGGAAGLSSSKQSGENTSAFTGR
ncbi:hypothetical protein W97_06951 [Coniosporium apollinis CBS 100218]|uniref:Uncharacterized protein n=1 Tax=Coniosporium apollinis (strain CBS 100218) TaxID=1168221 RepID=R7Z0J0_CONA1|nr:uncharacterized protein W97_06951 [Coniosporium apollinis CBS 100218]EON67583.1 hypothetical protein W97_06951 [Coniosporium apollinis CBS 100218]